MVGITQAIRPINVTCPLYSLVLNTVEHQFMIITQSKPTLEMARAVRIQSLEDTSCLLTQSLQFTSTIKTLGKFPTVKSATTKMEVTWASEFIMSHQKQRKDRSNITGCDSFNPVTLTYSCAVKFLFLLNSMTTARQESITVC
jgi:hypothetical protein